MKYQRTTTETRRNARAEAIKYLHISCSAYMVENPLNTATMKLAQVPYIEKPGSTYDIGRNKVKTVRRAAKRLARALLRAV